MPPSPLTTPRAAGGDGAPASSLRAALPSLLASIPRGPYAAAVPASAAVSATAAPAMITSPGGTFRRRIVP